MIILLFYCLVCSADLFPRTTAVRKGQSLNNLRDIFLLSCALLLSSHYQPPPLEGSGTILLKLLQTKGKICGSFTKKQSVKGEKAFEKGSLKIVIPSFESPTEVVDCAWHTLTSKVTKKD